MNFNQFQYFLSNTIWSGIDDKGYLFFLRSLFILFPKESVAYIVILLNAFFIAIASVALYKIMIFIDSTKKQNAIAVTSIFSSFLFFVNTSAVGLKEDIFVTIITLAIFYYVRFMFNKKIHLFLCCIFFTVLTVFFRTAITASLFTVFFAGIITTKSKKKMIVYGFIISLIALPFILDIVCQYILGIPLEHVLAVAQNRNADTSGADSGAKQIGNILASIIGPFPTFVDASDNMFYSYSSMVKMILNLPVLCAIFRILIRYDYRYYFVAFLYLIGIIFNIVAGTGLDMRYQIPFFGAFLFLLFYYLNTIELKSILLWGYSLGCAGITFIYNMIK